MTKRVFIAGPMSGYPQYNFPAFHQADMALTASGYDTYNPAAADLDDGFDPVNDKPHAMVYYMARNIPELCRCDAVALLPGWEDSCGADAEVTVAIACDIPVYELSHLLTGRDPA